jgi:S-adenosylmethionine-diacylglycerol 3-amino-3-carboxypropyl transferase
LDHSDFFQLFGDGRSLRAKEMYKDAIRPLLPQYARDYWDRHLYFFSGKGWRDSFFFRGTSGLVARLVSFNLLRIGNLRPSLEAMINAPDLATQEEIYKERISRKLWTPWMRWFLKQRMTMTLLGVPGHQLEQITTQYPGGLFQFIKDRLEHVLVKLPLKNN